ncbi:hypothetical protein [Chryseobacterium sp. CH1]|uniref:hypothetical protein n=1 Tax=Chryseobacterium sp. CH1 TaxID=713551 RepID=UPI00100BA315|nr:hypothetical protein [Chryseobacterium sp. CH1]RXM66583.1 hypothetical protein BOQ60_01055 [Chryseobacterium sp. CH1]
MKIFISVIMMFLMGCKPSATKGFVSDDMENKYSRKLSPDHRFTLFIDLKIIHWIREGGLAIM